jgi:hypothetical protein
MGTCEYSNDPRASTGARGVFEWLISCQLFNNGLAPCIHFMGYENYMPQFPLRDFTDIQLSLIMVYILDWYLKSLLRLFLGAFVKLRKAAINLVMLSPPACIEYLCSYLVDCQYLTFFLICHEYSNFVNIW